MYSAPSILYQILDQAFNQGDLSILDELIAPDAAARIPIWGITTSLQGLKHMIVTLRTAFPDLHCIMEDEIREGEKYAAIWSLQGAHEGKYFGNPPTGREVTVQGFIFARTMDDKIVEDWLLIDQMGLLQQLGIVPPPRGSVRHNRGV